MTESHTLILEGITALLGEFHDETALVLPPPGKFCYEKRRNPWDCFLQIAAGESSDGHHCSRMFPGSQKSDDALGFLLVHDTEGHKPMQDTIISFLKPTCCVQEWAPLLTRVEVRYYLADSSGMILGIFADNP